MVKRLTCLLITIIVCINFASCRVYNELKDIKQYKQDCRTFAEYIVTEDREAIYEMFSNECKGIDDFEEQFNTVMDLLYSYDLDYQNVVVDIEMCGRESAYSGGELVEWSLTPFIRNIYDSEGNEYEIYFSYVGISEEHPDAEGVDAISLWRIVNPDSSRNKHETILYIGNYFSIQNQQRFYYYPEE